MALFKCPECGKEISDKASSCPNCGYVLQQNSIRQKYENPNNFDDLQKNQALHKLKTGSWMNFISMAIILLLFLLSLIPDSYPKSNEHYDLTIEPQFSISNNSQIFLIISFGLFLAVGILSLFLIIKKYKNIKLCRKVSIFMLFASIISTSFLIFSINIAVLIFVGTIIAIPFVLQIIGSTKCLKASNILIKE